MKQVLRYASATTRMILWQKTYWLSDDVSAAIEATPCMLKHTHSKASTLLSRHILRCAAAALLLTLAAILCGQQTPFAAAANTTNSATKYEIVVFKDVMVPMRDGVKLACNIYRPALNGKLVDGQLPVILERTPSLQQGCRRVLDTRFRAAGLYRRSARCPRPIQFGRHVAILSRRWQRWLRHRQMDWRAALVEWWNRHGGRVVSGGNTARAGAFQPALFESHDSSLCYV